MWRSFSAINGSWRVYFSVKTVAPLFRTVNPTRYLASVLDRRVTHIAGAVLIGVTHIGNAHPCFGKGMLEGIPKVVVNGVVDGIAKVFVQAVVVSYTCAICLVIEIHEVGKQMCFKKIAHYNRNRQCPAYIQ